MPLPDYSPRSDSFGNWYFGGFQVDSSVEAGYGAGTALTATQADWDAFLDAALGGTNWIRSSNDYYFRFANAWEPLTGTISTTAQYRFAWRDSVSNDPIYTNTSLTRTPTLISGVTAFPFADVVSSARCIFAVANNYGITVASMVKGTTGSIGNADALFFHAGWVKDPVFPTNTTERIRNCISGRGVNGTTSAFSCVQAEGSTLRGLGSLSNIITCAVATPGANVTDVCVIDTSTSNLNIGRLHNVLVYPGQLTLGQIYRIPPGDDPDGNTEQNIWLCITDNAFVFDGSASTTFTSGVSRLMRVWSNNIT